MALVISAEGASGNELSTTMMVLGIWAQKGSAGQKVLENLGINDEKIAELGATVSISCTFLGMDNIFFFYIGKIFKFVNPSTKEPSHLRCQWFIHSVAIGVQLSRLHLQTWLELKSSWSTSYMSLISFFHSYDSVLGF